MTLGQDVHVDDGRHGPEVFGERDLEGLVATAGQVGVMRAERVGEFLEDAGHAVRGVGCGVVHVHRGDRVARGVEVRGRVERAQVGVAFALAEYDQAEDAHGDLLHSGEVVVVVDGQEVAVFVRVVDVELDAVEAV